MEKTKKKLFELRLGLGLIFFFACVAIYFLFVRDNVTLETLKQSAYQLKLFTQHNYWFAVFVYLSVFIISCLTLMPITILLTMAGGFLFGVYEGTLYAVLGVTIGSGLLFLFVRFFLGDWIQHAFEDQLEDFNHEVDVYGGRYVLVMQLLPISPTSLINLLAAVSNISLRAFLIATALGVLPGTVMYAWAGQQLHHVHSVGDIVGLPFIMLLIFFSLLIIASIVWKKWHG